MKSFWLIFFLICSFTFCKAQQTVALFHSSSQHPTGTYYKDFNHDLDKFVGTWKWQSENTVFTIIFQKKEHLLNSVTNHYEDMIIGEYKYAENGQEVLNYLPRLQDNNIVGNNHYISGNLLYAKNDIPKCDECSPFERRLEVTFTDPEREYIPSNIVLRHQTINGVEQLTAILGGSSSYAVTEENLPSQPRVPYGTYVLIKQ